MRIRWTPTALRDLESLHAYVTEDNPKAAAAAAGKIVAGVEALSRHANLGRPGRVHGTRELVIPPYVVVYKVRKEAIEAVAILHGARRWPDSF
jgi:toxin ParE1/3/4